MTAFGTISSSLCVTSADVNMDSPAFVLSAAAPSRRLLARSTILGRAMPRFVTARCRRVALPMLACASADLGMGEQGDSKEGDSAQLSTDPAAPRDEVSASNPKSEDSNESPAMESDEKKRRRRRRPKREVTLPLEDMTVGMELEGTVKSVMEYGAFVGDMGTPTDGLLHVSQLQAGFVEKVTDVVNVGDKLKVRVMGIDAEKGNFSLTMKTADEIASNQTGRDRKQSSRSGAESRQKKWDEFSYDPEVFVDARVTSVTDFGAFCELLNENGEPLESAPTDGLVHISELSEDRVSKVSDVLREGQTVKVRVVSTDKKRNRMSMSLRAYSVKNYTPRDGEVAANLAEAQSKQPEFKSAFELAFERAKGKE